MVRSSVPTEPSPDTHVTPIPATAVELDTARFHDLRPRQTAGRHPRAANPVRRLEAGPYAGRFIYWFHNHPGKGYDGRNPAFLLGGVEVDTPRRKNIDWGEPVAVLYAIDPNVRIGYPDFIWDDGLYITETQKSIARVRSSDELLAQVFKAHPVEASRTNPSVRFTYLDPGELAPVGCPAADWKALLSVRH